jgi:hypothetical protein
MFRASERAQVVPNVAERREQLGAAEAAGRRIVPARSRRTPGHRSQPAQQNRYGRNWLSSNDLSRRTTVISENDHELGCRHVADWSRRFYDPINLPNGRKLVTLKDAAAYITGLPKTDQGLGLGYLRSDTSAWGRRST